MTYRLEWSKNATKQLLKIPKQQRLILLKWVKENLDGCSNPRTVPNKKQLQGTNHGWRWRVGSYRILGTIESEKLTVSVVRAGHRQGVYHSLPKL